MSDVSDRDELLKLLDQVSSEPGVEQTIEETEDLEEPEAEVAVKEEPEVEPEAKPEVEPAAEPEEEEPLIPTEATPQKKVDPEVEIYASITLTGLRTHRPDLVQAVEKSAGRSKAKKRPASGERDWVDDFVAYYKLGVGMLQDDPNSVTKRRLSHMRKKFFHALAQLKIELADGADVAFVINGAAINAAWAGEKPTNLPSELDI